jgi:LPXTG-site transpeptidase (sortase) family protein
MPLSRFIQTIGLFLSLTLILLQASAQAFTDVSDHFKYGEAINSLSNLGIINGYPDGSFQPEKTISRAEAAKILVGAVKPLSIIEETQNNLYSNNLSTPFPDVGNEEWFAPYVTLSTQNGITQGYSDGFFRPANTINMAEGLKMILETYGMDATRARYVEHPLLLIGPDDWFTPYFEYSYNHNLINREKFYHPAQGMTRGEFAEILYRLKTIRESGKDSYIETDTPYSDEYTLTIPRLNIINVNVSFADPFDSNGSLGVLHAGLGHYLSPPGGGHKMVIFGHSSGYNWDHSPYKYIFTKIDQIQDGDLIYLNYQEKGYIYQVNKKEIRPATDMDPVMKDYGYEEMALYTCWPPNGISKRYVVYATPVL